MPTCTHQRLPIGSLSTDSSLVEDVDPDAPAVERLCRHYQRDRLGVFVVSRRADASLVVLDGAIRRQAVLRMEMREFLVDCKVYTGLDRADEAMTIETLHHAEPRDRPRRADRLT